MLHKASWALSEVIAEEWKPVCLQTDSLQCPQLYHLPKRGC
jgi:hypothetical protein